MYIIDIRFNLHMYLYVNKIYDWGLICFVYFNKQALLTIL